MNVSLVSREKLPIWGSVPRTVSARELSLAADIRLPRPGAEAGPCIRGWWVGRPDVWPWPREGVDRNDGRQGPDPGPIWGSVPRTVSARELSLAADIRLPRPGAEAGPC